MKLELQQIKKSFDGKEFLHGVIFSVEGGNALGLLGRNGAGKTTTIRIIMDVFHADSGEVLFDGEPFKYQPGQVGYLPEERGLYPKRLISEQLIYLAMLRGLDRKQAEINMKKWLARLDVAQYEKKKLDTLSKGNQQKVQILATLVHEPELVMLDEPFSGFDPINGILLSNLIDRLKERGATIILSSHNMPAVEEICTDITLINKGRVLLSGSLADIKQKNKEGKYLFCLSKPYARSGNGNEVIGEIAVTDNPPGRNGSSYLITPAENATPRQLLNHISSNNEILLFEEKLPSLNEIFIKYAK